MLLRKSGKITAGVSERVAAAVDAHGPTTTGLSAVVGLIIGLTYPELHETGAGLQPSVIPSVHNHNEPSLLLGWAAKQNRRDIRAVFFFLLVKYPHFQPQI